MVISLGAFLPVTLVWVVLGITFSSRPIKINERVHLKIIDIDETRQWLGSLGIGQYRRE